MRVLPLIAALLLGASASFLAACGDRNHLIPSGAAQKLIDHLASVENAVGDRNCAATGQALAQARGDYINLPANVDQRLRARIGDGLKNLNLRAAIECQEAPKTLSTATTNTATATDTTTTDTTPSTTETTTTTATTATITAPTTATTTPGNPGGATDTTTTPGATTP